MTPYEIGVLLHYYARAEDHEDLHRRPPVWADTLTKFMAADLIRYLSERERAALYPMVYQLTERGRAYCESLQRVPLPESVWVTHWPSPHWPPPEAG